MTPTDKAKKGITPADLHTTRRVVTYFAETNPDDPIVGAYRVWIDRYMEFFALIEGLSHEEALAVLHNIGKEKC